MQCLYFPTCRSAPVVRWSLCQKKEITGLYSFFSTRQERQRRQINTVMQTSDHNWKTVHLDVVMGEHGYGYIGKSNNPLATLCSFSYFLKTNKQTKKQSNSLYMCTYLGSKADSECVVPSLIAYIAYLAWKAHQITHGCQFNTTKGIFTETTMIKKVYLYWTYQTHRQSALCQKTRNAN